MGCGLLHEMIDLGGDGLIPLDAGDAAGRQVAVFVPARASGRAGPVVIGVPTASAHISGVIGRLSTHPQGPLAAAGGFPGVLGRYVRHDVLLSEARSTVSC